jgi:signal transduction histidine kinase
VRLSAREGQLVVSVTDDGVGFRSNGSPPVGHGLQTMRERAEELRGRLLLTSGAGHGTTVTAEIPLAPGAEPRPSPQHDRDAVASS